MFALAMRLAGIRAAQEHNPSPAIRKRPKQANIISASTAHFGHRRVPPRAQK
jgi:hypothetical protein